MWNLVDQREVVKTSLNPQWRTSELARKGTVMPHFYPFFRGPKSMDYPKFQRAQTFWTKCLNLFQTKKCQNRFCVKLQLCPLVDMCSFCNIATIWWWHNYSSLIHNPQSWLLGHLSGLLSPRTSIRKLSSPEMEFVKILHCRIFGLKILHHQFHLISTVLVRKTQKNE